MRTVLALSTLALAPKPTPTPQPRRFAVRAAESLAQAPEIQRLADRGKRREYEEIGTHPQANFNAVSVAINFHRSIGADRKIARLRWLRDRWAKALLEHSDRVHVLTELGPDKAGAIALFNVDGLEPGKLGNWLLANYRIVNTPIGHPEFNGIRITPSIYTSPDEIDTFVDAVEVAIRKGIAA